MYVYIANMQYVVRSSYAGYATPTTAQLANARPTMYCIRLVAIYKMIPSIPICRFGGVSSDKYSRGGFSVWNGWSQWPSFQWRHSEPLFSLQHKFGLMICIDPDPVPGGVGGVLWWSGPPAYKDKGIEFLSVLFPCTPPSGLEWGKLGLVHRLTSQYGRHSL